MRRSDIAAVLATSIALWTGAAGAQGVAAGPLACRPGGLVDAEFRDAALQALDRLVVRAPGHSADGAIKVHHSPGHLDPQGAVWHYVSAYQVNLALVGALRVAPHWAPTAAQWLRWQAGHTTRTGPSESVVFDHWVRASDLQESTCPPGKSARACPQVDAYDSTAASLLLMAYAYAQATADSTVLREPPVRRALEEAAATLVRLTQPNGLPWAKPDHQVAYLMDAVEVSAGWRAWAQLQRDVYGVPQAAKNSLAMAQRTDAAVQKNLWHAPSQTWRVSLDAGQPQFTHWYPDSVAQAWPLLWMDGAHAEGSAAVARAQSVWRQTAAHWQGRAGWSQRNVDPEGFWWPAVAVAARCVGDDTAAAAWVARARSAWLRPDALFAWPFQVADLQWLLWLAEPVPPPGAPAF
ncbi:hypothetical protein [Rhodoferax sp. WC2427]|uniref:hypothetical protein n=1 Tax=Rhodoferax sp. WC2427 TaxID=3234144 RepID=UPI003464ED63